MFILLYADDTVIFSDNETDLQSALLVFQEYYQKWKLSVNTSKTKVLIFGRGKLNKTKQFRYQNEIIETVTDYKYLGIYFSRSGSFIVAKKHIAEQANKAVFALIKNIRSLSLPFDIRIDLFNKTIKPILLYRCEIWGFGNIDMLEKIQLNYFKTIFGLKRSTPSYMIYGELGIMPLSIDIQTRTISFWSKLTDTDDLNKLSSLLYKIIYGMSFEQKVKSLWLNNIKSLLCSLGFSGVWYSQSFLNSKWLVKAINNKMKDLFLQKWNTNLEMTSNSIFYKIIKTNFRTSKYLSRLPESLCKLFLRFRTRNHRLPIEIGRWQSVPLMDRKCNKCNLDIGDEFHYLLVCSHFSQSRSKYLKSYYYTCPNTLKLDQLMNTENGKELRNLCHLIKIILKNV